MSRLALGFDFSFQRKDRADDFLDQNAPPDLGMKMFGLTMLMIGLLWLERRWLQRLLFAVEASRPIARGACRGAYNPWGCVAKTFPIHRESTDVRALALPRLSATIGADSTRTGPSPNEAFLGVDCTYRFGLRSLPRSSEFVAGWTPPRDLVEP